MCQELDDQSQSLEIDRYLRELQTAGFTVLDDAVEAGALALVRARFDELLDDAISDGDPAVLHPTGTNRANMWIPLAEPFLAAEIVARPLVLSVLRAVLGNEVLCTYYASDTAFPGSDYQPVHPDVGPLFGGLSVSLPTVNIVLDIPLVDFSEDNGPLEIWTGATHLIADCGVVPREAPGSGPEALLTPNQRFASTLPSRRLLLPAGSLLLRDTRVWHRGTPNRSSERRSMLALVYSRQWWIPDLLPIDGETYQALPEEIRMLFRRARPRRAEGRLAAASS